MRLKLVMLTSLVAAAIGSAISFLESRAAGGYQARVISPNLFSRPVMDLGLLFAPIAVVAVVASIFVYRHTARRRKTQAGITVILSFILAVLALYLISYLLPPSLRLVY